MNRSPQLELLKHSRVQDAEDADDGLVAADAQMDRCGVAGEEGRVCAVGTGLSAPDLGQSCIPTSSIQRSRKASDVQKAKPQTHRPLP